VIKYLGSKRLLIEPIVAAVGAHPGARTVLDLFSGTSRVGHALKGRGYRVVANDHNAYAATLARCYVQADREEWAAKAERLLAELMETPPEAGWFTETYCVQSRYFHPDNGAKIEAIRNAIAERALEPELEAIALTSLMEAADRVDSTTGVQMAYLKQWARRAHNPLELRLPALLPRAEAGKGRALELDAFEAAESEADVAYLDPPYNQHKYLGNYHVWETLVRWDEPETYGIARKRIDCRARKSVFNSKPRIEGAMRELVAKVKAPTLVVSFSDEGYLDREAMEAILASRGEVRVFEHAYRRYVGARIGIHDPKGRKVGKISHLKNKERLFVVSHDPAILASL
jgi:adenine-specific DNA-methyltransferase